MIQKKKTVPCLAYTRKACLAHACAVSQGPCFRHRRSSCFPLSVPMKSHRDVAFVTVAKAIVSSPLHAAQFRKDFSEELKKVQEQVKADALKKESGRLKK